MANKKHLLLLLVFLLATLLKPMSMEARGLTQANLEADGNSYVVGPSVLTYPATSGQPYTRRCKDVYHCREGRYGGVPSPPPPPY